MTQPIVPGRLSAEQRATILQQALGDLAFRGYQVERVDQTRAIVLAGAPINHILHLLLSVFTCGLWLPIWLLILASGGVKRRYVHIDDYGNLIGL